MVQFLIKKKHKIKPLTFFFSFYLPVLFLFHLLTIANIGLLIHIHITYVYVYNGSCGCEINISKFVMSSYVINRNFYPHPHSLPSQFHSTFIFKKAQKKIFYFRFTNKKQPTNTYINICSTEICCYICK